MGLIRHSIDVDVPVSVAYQQWIQIEDFPHFMESVEEVQQISATQVHFVTRMVKKRKAWKARITEQIPEQLITWESDDGDAPYGMVTFGALDEDKTRMKLEIHYEPVGAIDRGARLITIVSHQIGQELERFKRFIENCPAAAEAWRSAVP